MPQSIFTIALDGLDAQLVEVQSHVSRNLPKCVIVGLPDIAVQEARERIKSAITNSQCEYPRTQITVNLAPASLRKEGTWFDVPIALSILVESGELRIRKNYEQSVYIGELALDGRIMPVRGVIAAVMTARQLGFSKIFVPLANYQEAHLIPGIEVLPLSHIDHCINFHNKSIDLPRYTDDPVSHLLTTIPKDHEICFSYISGQSEVKRALEIVAAGGHNILLAGPPGTGKTLLARALPSILPNLTEEESLEVTRIASITRTDTLIHRLITDRPFRAPHHNSSEASLVGGGSIPRPGEITRAHKGVLFLDELAEFSRRSIDMLRQPLEERRVVVARAHSTYVFPADFTLVAATNPCPCGYAGDKEHKCTCSPRQIVQYEKKLSGPILDRIDLYVDVPRVPIDDIQKTISEKSIEIKKRVEYAREVQYTRFGLSRTNNTMTTQDIKRFCSLSGSAEKLLYHAMTTLHLSMRAYHKVIKVGRTIADLAHTEIIEESHIAEAIRYRKK